MSPSWILNYRSFVEDTGEMPISATGIQLLDPSNDFRKGNIRWVTKFNRKKIGLKTNKRPYKIFNNRRNLNICIEQDQFEKLLQISKEWVINDESSSGCTISELMRDIINTFLNVAKEVKNEV